MLVGRVLEAGARGPAAALQTFLAGLMHACGAAKLLAPAVVAPGRVQPEWIPQGGSLSRVNPLLPLMQSDAVSALRSGVQDTQAGSVVAVLRPCEVRAAWELGRKRALNLERVIVVGVDCLSTYELAHWSRGHESHPGDPDWLVAEALELAQTGQVRTEGYWAVCELCDRPAPDYRAADILVGLVGVPNRERLLILSDQDKDARWGLHSLCDRAATERETADREVTLWRLADRRRQAAAARLESLGLIDGDPRVIEDYLRRCTLCGQCVDACPLWAEELRAALEAGREAFIEALGNATQRLAGCAVCGMCQIHCVEGIPLRAIQQVQQRVLPGPTSLRDPLPGMA